MLQPTIAPPSPQARPVRPVRARSSVTPARAYLALNLCLGLLIIAGLALLALREAPSTAPSASANE